VIDRIIFFDEEHFFNFSKVEILKLLEISIILAHILSSIPEIGKDVFIKEFLEYHGGNIFYVE
jgi:hypothetical protein